MTARPAVRIGVIGLGVMGSEHARLLAREVSGAQVGAVYDVDPARMQQAAASTGARVLDDPLRLVEDDDVDAVLVASADATHEQFVLACVAAGKPVLCEKPLAPTADGCRRIVDAEAAHGRSLVTVGFMRRYDPGFVAMRAALHGGELGRALVLHCVHRNVSYPGVSAEALIRGSAVHEFDTAAWLLGEPLESVTVHRCGTPAGQDPLLFVLRSASGTLVDVEVFCNAAYGYDVRCELVAEHGSVDLDAYAPTALRRAGTHSTAVVADWRGRFAEAYRRELQDWLDAIHGDVPARGAAAASAMDGYVATLVADAAVAALDGGPRHITVPAGDA